MDYIDALNQKIVELQDELNQISSAYDEVLHENEELTDKLMEIYCEYPGVDCYFCIKKPCLKHL